VTHPVPVNDLEEAADVAFKAAEAYLELHGLTLTEGLISLKIAELPETGDSVTAMHGLDNPVDALKWLSGTIGGLAKSLGIEVRFIPVGGDG
jgi:hypothetical protein